MVESYHVRIAKAEHVFSAAHFITFGGHVRTAARAQLSRRGRDRAARSNENHLVIDFLLVRAKLLEITSWLDHYVLLPTEHPQIRVEDNGREVTATFADRRWVFPSGDCRLLPVANTTSELLATYIGKPPAGGLGRRCRQHRRASAWSWMSATGRSACGNRPGASIAANCDFVPAANSTRSAVSSQATWSPASIRRTDRLRAGQRDQSARLFSLLALDTS